LKSISVRSDLCYALFSAIFPFSPFPQSSSHRRSRFPGSVLSFLTGNFLTDILGSPVALTDNAGVVQTEYTYEPFGKTTFNGPSNTNPYQYTGRENDSTGLYHYRARYYHPASQRFISEDPIEFGGEDVNLYAYVWNNPLIY